VNLFLAGGIEQSLMIEERILDRYQRDSYMYTTRIGDDEWYSTMGISPL
jgi:hypothetical protein